MQELVIRPQQDGDVDAILDVVERAFGSRHEVALVAAVQASPAFVPELSLVAQHHDELLGHVMLSYVTLETDAEALQVLSLAPVSVAPERQRRGIGSALIRAALERADERGDPLVLVEGSPTYYARFGFENARAHGIMFTLPDWAPPEAGQVRRLRSYHPRVRGRVVYPPAFDAVS